ncbi:MAG: 5'-nucleotidase, partial [Xanthobacteraceae bacterium]
RNFRYKLIPLFADAIAPDPEMTAAVDAARGPFLADLMRVVGHTESLLYRRGTFHASFDDLIGTAVRAERDAEISFSPGYRWGTTVLPGSAIKLEDIFNATAIAYPEVYRASISGARIKEILEGAADGLCNPDPYWRLGRDMLRCGGLAYALDPRKPAGSRISALRLLATGKPVEADKSYVVAGWGNVAERLEGPPIWDAVEKYIAREKTVQTTPQTEVKLVGV